VVEIAGVKYLLKRYNCRGWLYRLGNTVRRSRALRAWLVNWHLLVRGIPVPVPLLCLEERRWRLLERSYVLMEYVENALTLRERWTFLGEKEKRDFLELCADLLGRMHRMGMLHGDLKWDNILVGEIPSPDNLRLVDLDGSTTMTHFSFWRARKDFDRFLKDLSKQEGDGALLDYALRAWGRGLA
jgi:tRNA A-37 threonylcarbamoyl transferase component Bud32